MKDALVALPHADRGKRMVLAGLSAAYERALAEEPARFDLRSGRLVIFSDHHRGAGDDDADDFRRCERAYRTALAFYCELGHTVALLGDVDELWENRIARTIDAYAEVLALESRLHREGRLWRFYGNHDLVWSSPGKVTAYLGKRFDDVLTIREALALDVYDGDSRIGRVFLAHGHQGTPSSDLFAPVAMIPVRYVWPKLQRSFKFASTTPAADFKLRAAHDSAMHEWGIAMAKRRRDDEPPVVLIAGHTHKPVFYERLADDSAAAASGASVTAERPTRSAAQEAYDAAVAAGAPAHELARLHAMLEFVSTKDFGLPSRPVVPPCYFNSGCCSYADGDVTALVIDDGHIQLVRWLNNDGDPEVHGLSERAPLADVFQQVRQFTR